MPTKTTKKRTPAKTTKKRAAAPKKRASRSAAKRVPAGVSGAAKKGSPPRERSSGPASGDAIAVLKQDHRDAQQLFRRFEKAGDDAHGVKRQLVDTMVTSCGTRRAASRPDRIPTHPTNRRPTHCSRVPSPCSTVPGP